MKFLKRIFSDQEPLEVEVEKADAVFKENKTETIAKAWQKSERLQKSTDNIVQGLKTVLEDIEGFQDDKGRKAVDDIAENLVDNRKEVIENFSSKKNPEENLEAVREFMRDFQDLKRKEAAVLEITAKEKEIGGYMKQLEDLSDEIESFLEEEYSAVKSHERLKEIMEKIDESESEIDGLKNNLEEINIEVLESSVKEKRKEVQNFRQGQEMEEYEGLKEKAEKMKKQRKDIVETVDSSLSKMKRGLKKLVYQSQNSGLELKYPELLRLMRDQKTGEIREKPEKVEKALPQLREKGEISETQREKLLKGISSLENLSDIETKIEDLDKNIEKIEFEISEHPAPEKLQSMEKEAENLEKELEKKKEKKQDIKSDIEDFKSRKKDLKQEIKSIFESNFDREIKF